MYRDIADIAYLLDVLVVIVYISHCNCWIIYYCMRIEVSVLRAGRGRGGGGSFFAKSVPGVLKRQKKFLGGCWGCLGRPTPPPGGRAGLENDTFLPMTMTRDWLKFWNGSAWRSKVIIRKPWRQKNKKKI